MDLPDPTVQADFRDANNRENMRREERRTPNRRDSREQEEQLDVAKRSSFITRFVKWALTSIFGWLLITWLLKLPPWI